MKNLTKNYGFDHVIGKKISETKNIDFGTCYPLVAENDTDNKNAKIIGIVCAEFGDGIFDKYSRRIGTYETDGNTAWEIDERG